MIKEEEFELPTDYTKLDWRNGDNRKVREQYVAIQEGKCYWCKCDLHDGPSQQVQDANIDWSLFPKGFKNSPVHLQHNHDTNMTEGAVHMKCNAYMWQYLGR